MLREFLFRLAKPTPKFFRDLRNIGIGLGAVGGALLTAPVVLPAAVISLGGYLVVTGSVMGVIAQTATDRHHLQKKQKNGRYAKGLAFEE